MFRAGRLVRMSADDDVESRRDGIKIEGVNVVENVNCCGVCFDDFGFGQSQRPWLRIYISPHSKNWPESLQHFKNFRIAHIARMNN